MTEVPEPQSSTARPGLRSHRLLLLVVVLLIAAGLAIGTFAWTGGDDEPAFDPEATLRTLIERNLVSHRPDALLRHALAEQEWRVRNVGCVADTDSRWECLFDLTGKGQGFRYSGTLTCDESLQCIWKVDSADPVR
jgi:hypothetical protein